LFLTFITTMVWTNCMQCLYCLPFIRTTKRVIVCQRASVQPCYVTGTRVVVWVRYSRRHVLSLLADVMWISQYWWWLAIVISCPCLLLQCQKRATPLFCPVLHVHGTR